MRDKLLYIIVFLIPILLLSALPVVPVNAFIYPDCTVDTRYEFYGPHADQMIFQMYATDESMWDALALGQIDLTDWPLTTARRTQPPPAGFLGDPNVKIVSAGGEAGYYTIDFNYNPNPRMGNPPGAPMPGFPNGRPNPVYINTTVPGIPPISNDPNFRLGCGNLFDRATFNAFVGAAGIGILTPIPSYMSGWMWPGLTGYPYDRTLAEAQFAAGNIKQDKTTTPWTRYWDIRPTNDLVDPGEKEACVLKMTWRMDAYRKKAGTMLYAELQAMNFTFDAADSGIRTGGANYQQVMLDKRYHITTLGWIFVGPDPDHVYDLYHISGYWDDPTSSAPNTAALNDTVLNTESEGVKFAKDSAEALGHIYLWQQRFEAICAQIPLFSNNAFKASRKWYSGGNAETPKIPDDGENAYRGKPWKGLCNQMGFGSNSFWSLLNMYPECHLYGTGAMTIRYGWKEQQYPQHINPFYSEWYWDAIVLGSTYDSLGYRDPYNLAKWQPYLIKSWSVGTWFDSKANATKSKCTITLRSDVKFHDGTPVTIADVIFSLVEAGPMLLAKGYQPPWWWPTGELVKSLSIVDPCTVEILYDVYSFLVESWTLGGFYIVPKHIWKPIIEDSDPNPPTVFCPDPNVIGTGPYRYLKFTKLSSLVMVANKPGSVVKTDQPGARPVTSPGYFHYYPIHADVHTLHEWHNKVPIEYRYPEEWYCTQWNYTKGEHGYIGTQWHLMWFPFNVTYDTNLNGILDQCDYINMTLKKDEIPVGPWRMYHVYKVEKTGPGPIWPPCNVTIWTDWYSQKIYPCDEAAFGIELENVWVNPIPNTAYAPATGELLVEKIVKLSVEQIIPYESGTIFSADQYLHFQWNTTIHLQTNTTIHFINGGIVLVKLPGETVYTPRTVTPSTVMWFGNSTHLIFPPSMEIEFLEETGVHWLGPTLQVIEASTQKTVQYSTRLLFKENLTYIHFKNFSRIEWKNATEKVWNSLEVPASTVMPFNATDELHFLGGATPTCMVEIHFLDTTRVDLLAPITEVQIKETEEIWLRHGEPHKEIFNLHFKKCHYDIKVIVHIIGPPLIVCDPIVVPNPWLSRKVVYRFDFWSTIPPDIGGKTFISDQLPAPDCKVDMKDVYAAAKGFGSYPGHIRWSVIADLNKDYKIDMKDIYAIARNFGWKC